MAVVGVLHQFPYLNVGLALVLCFVGVKMASYLAIRREAGAQISAVDDTASNPHSHHPTPDSTALEGPHSAPEPLPAYWRWTSGSAGPGGHRPANPGGYSDRPRPSEP